jgi:hypothetical protein
MLTAGYFSLTSEGKSSEMGHFLLINKSIPANFEWINATQLIHARKNSNTLLPV